MGDLGSKRDLGWQNPDWIRYMATGRVAQVVEQIAVQDLGPVAAQGQRLPVLRYDPIVLRIEGVNGTHDCRLVPVDGGDRAHLALPLQVPESSRLDPGGNHVLENRSELVIARSGHVWSSEEGELGAGRSTPANATLAGAPRITSRLGCPMAQPRGIRRWSTAWP